MMSGLKKADFDKEVNVSQLKLNENLEGRIHWGDVRGITSAADAAFINFRRELDTRSRGVPDIHLRISSHRTVLLEYEPFPDLSRPFSSSSRLKGAKAPEEMNYLIQFSSPSVFPLLGRLPLNLDGTRRSVGAENGGQVRKRSFKVMSAPFDAA